MILSKLRTKLNSPVHYFLDDNDSLLSLNNFLGKELSISWSGKIICSKCKKSTKKSFGEGFCFTCFQTVPEASPCILKPELCRAHLGEGRDVLYEQLHHLQPHVVYLACTDIVKVGVTRKTQIPTRWIDQGAAEVIVVAETENRYQAGIIEVAMKDFYTDKTNWKNMLINKRESEIDLIQEKWEAHEQMPSDLSVFWTENDDILLIHYPVNNYPDSVRSITLDEFPAVKGVLTGIRGQYLYFDEQNVLNIRRHTGYDVTINL
ncbi:MAG: DUF2797 domain-containing protein [Crocinitomicaceae bacterium]